MNKIIYGMILVLISMSASYAQMVGTIGIGDLSINDSSYDTSLRSKRDIITSFNTQLNDALLETRKFRVLNYTQLNAFLNERSINLEPYYFHSNKPENYLLAGLDYILTAQINEFGVYTQKRGASNIATGIIDISFKLIGVADKTTDLQANISAQTRIRVSSSDLLSRQGAIDETIEKGVDTIIARITSRLFPIRISQLYENGSVRLNYGEGLLTPGNTVFIFDGEPDDIFNTAGETTTEAISTLQVIETRKRYSIAQPLSGADKLEVRKVGQNLQDN